MKNKNTSLPQQYFDDVYSTNEDPWNYQTSKYEKEKYEATINALTKAKYNNVFEIGCSIGVLSTMLAVRCNSLLSIDVSEIPLKKAKANLSEFPHAVVKQMRIPEEFPHDMFDLIVLSEVGYYLSMEDLYKTQELILTHLEQQGQLLLVHWTPFVHDYPLTGDQVHESFLSLSGDKKPLQHIKGSQQEKYRLDLFSKR